MIGPLITGWTSDLDVPSALRRASSELSSDHRVLISMLDSTPRVSELPGLVNALGDLRERYGVVGHDVVVGLKTVFTLADEFALFTGFDEVWVFREDPKLRKPDAIRLTCDIELETLDEEAVSGWMQRVQCLAGLGDGHGLNFATFDPGLADRWREATPGAAEA